ncbi:unnamed protein product [Hermetia illucens]|uniref:Thioredoxin n=1 Tax=Hermetia illucens TaxID=343691 RepID=A0A7R8URJ2_HERIL|nr:thioredoxin-2 [Hermetia illucens]CAD7085430.1 unnamed protein product [Hermetia illucens]
MVYIVQNKEDFRGKLQSAGDKLVVVDFFATWCGPCKIISPKLEELANKYGDRVVVLKVDVDDCDELDVEYGVSSMPTFIFIKNGEKIDSFVGANAEKLEKHFAKHIEPSS